MCLMDSRPYLISASQSTSLPQKTALPESRIPSVPVSPCSIILLLLLLLLVLPLLLLLLILIILLLLLLLLFYSYNYH